MFDLSRSNGIQFKVDYRAVACHKYEKTPLWLTLCRITVHAPGLPTIGQTDSLYISRKILNIDLLHRVKAQMQGTSHNRWTFDTMFSMVMNFICFRFSVSFVVSMGNYSHVFSCLYYNITPLNHNNSKGYVYSLSRGKLEFNQCRVRLTTAQYSVH